MDKQLSAEVVHRILKCRDALIVNDRDEAYHQIYAIASPTFDKYFPWDEMEKQINYPKFNEEEIKANREVTEYATKLQELLNEAVEAEYGFDDKSKLQAKCERYEKALEEIGNFPDSQWHGKAVRKIANEAIFAGVMDKVACFSIEQVNEMLVEFALAYCKAPNKDIANDAAEYLSDKLKEDKTMTTEWQPIDTAPKDGSTIEVAHDDEGNETSFAFWSERPVCMLGNRCGGFPPGWATAPEQDTDTNLPLREVFMWRPI